MYIKKNEDFDFQPGTELYKLQQKLCNNFKLKEISSNSIITNNSYVVDKDMNYYKVTKIFLNKTLKDLNIGYFSINYKNNNINIWSARKDFRICS